MLADHIVVLVDKTIAEDVKQQTFVVIVQPENRRCGFAEFEMQILTDQQVEFSGDIVARFIVLEYPGHRVEKLFR